MDFLVPHDRNDIIMEHAPAALLSSLMPLSPNLSTITPSRFINTRWLCPAIFQCHLGFLIGIGASTPITAVSGRETRKVLRDPDADLVRYEPGKPPPSFSTMAWLARWFNRVISPHQHYDNTRFSSERRTASAFPLNFQNRPMTAEASLRAHHQLPLLRYTSAPIPLSNTTDLPNDRRTLSTLQANSRSLFSNFVSLISLRRHRLIQTPTTTAATTGSAATLASSSRTTATTATTVTTTTAPVFRVYEH
ncbi:hypothetical protein BDF19DRAFT_453151 [Syncephalis fuscata]|nr:hypothetical protein BDF19DRAFT_453151 [Syncephalis fuscata]